MRPEIYEYQYDWLVHQGLGLVEKIGNGTPKEIKMTLPNLPYFERPVDLIYSHGEKVPKALFKLLATWIGLYYNAEKMDHKRVMTTFIVNPMILNAMNIAAVNVELMTIFSNLFYRRGAYDFMDHCIEEGYTETSCSAQRATLGAYLAGLAKDFDAIVINSTGVCDSNANAFAFMANHLDKPLYAMDFPEEIPNADVSDYVLKDMKGMVAFLKEHTGQTVDYDKLRKLLKESEIQEEIAREIQEMQCLVPCPVPALYVFMLYLGRNIMMGAPELTDLFREMYKDIKANADAGRAGTKSGKEKARIHMFYLDHFNTDMEYFRWMYENDYSHMGMVASPTFYHSQEYLEGNEEMGWKIDISSEDAMLITIAEMGQRQPMARNLRGPYDAPNQFLEETLTMSRLYKADCGIFQGTYGCRNCWSNIQPMSKELEKAGLPTLICTADAIDERPQSWVQSRAQIEEFLAVRGII